MENQRIYEVCKYKFTEVELFELGSALAQETQHLINLQNEKRNAAKTIAASIEQSEQRMKGLALKINQGYELRDVEVRVLFDEPKPGFKSFFRTDTGEVVREQEMTPEERQRVLFPAEGPKPQ